MSKLTEADIEVIYCDPGAFYYTPGRQPFSVFTKIVADIEGWGRGDPPLIPRYRRVRLRAYRTNDGDEYMCITFPPKGTPGAFMATYIDTAAPETETPWDREPDDFAEWLEKGGEA